MIFIILQLKLWTLLVYVVFIHLVGEVDPTAMLLWQFSESCDNNWEEKGVALVTWPGSLSNPRPVRCDAATSSIRQQYYYS